MTDCAAGNPDPNYSCRFCHVPLHSGSSGCGCSTFRSITHYASLCLSCADAIDELLADTPVGRVHRALVRDADLRGRNSDDIGV